MTAVLGTTLEGTRTARAEVAPVESVMAALRAVGSAEADFVEERTLSQLTAPLVSRGLLLYRAPDHLERRATVPVAESLVMDGDRLTYSRAGDSGSRSFGLDRAPELRALAEAFRSTLAGDLATLRRYYSVGFEGDLGAWRLTLVPLDARARALVTAVRIEGARAAVTEVLTTEADGDRTRMTVAYRG